MSGRREQEYKIEEKIQEILSNQPQIIVDYSHSFGNKTYTTKKSYLYNAIHFKEFLMNEYNLDVCNKEQCALLNYSHITSYMEFIKYGYNSHGIRIRKENGSCAVNYYAIKHFCNYLFFCKYITENPCNNVEKPKDNKEHDIISLTPAEIKTIERNIRKGAGTSKAIASQKKWINRDLCIVMIGITTAMRVSAIKNIDVSDIDYENKILKTTEKGNRDRTIYLSDKMIELIKTWLVDRETILDTESCNALFISNRKQRIAGTTISHLLEKYSYNIDKHITPHKLRSTAATNLLEKTGDIYLVADLLGHKNIENTKRYAKVSTHKKQMAVDTLSKLF